MCCIQNLLMCFKSGVHDIVIIAKRQTLLEGKKNVRILHAMKNETSGVDYHTDIYNVMYNVMD